MKQAATLIAAACLIGLAGCSLFGGPEAGSILDPTDATGPQSDFESLVGSAIHRAVVEEKDIPDYQLIKNKEKIVVSNRTVGGEEISSGALPEAEAVEFVLASPETIHRIANDEGDFLYLQVGPVEINGAEAAVSLNTTWAVAEDSEVHYLSGGGYKLQYKKRSDGWVFEKILMMWIS